jgi:hypothetical protein
VRKFFFAIRTTVNIALRVCFRRERQIVATRFVRDSQIAARFAPFCSMWRDSAPANAKLREQMRQLMPQRSINLVGNRHGASLVLL